MMISTTFALVRLFGITSFLRNGSSNSVFCDAISEGRPWATRGTRDDCHAAIHWDVLARNKKLKTNTRTLETDESVLMPDRSPKAELVRLSCFPASSFLLPYDDQEDAAAADHDDASDSDSAGGTKTESNSNGENLRASPLLIRDCCCQAFLASYSKALASSSRDNGLSNNSTMRMFDRKDCLAGSTWMPPLPFPRTPHNVTLARSNDGTSSGFPDVTWTFWWNNDGDIDTTQPTKSDELFHNRRVYEYRDGLVENRQPNDNDEEIIEQRDNIPVKSPSLGMSRVQLSVRIGEEGGMHRRLHHRLVLLPPPQPMDFSKADDGGDEGNDDVSISKESVNTTTTTRLWFYFVVPSDCFVNVQEAYDPLPPSQSLLLQQQHNTHYYTEQITNLQVIVAQTNERECDQEYERKPYCGGSITLPEIIDEEQPSFASPAHAVWIYVQVLTSVVAAGKENRTTIQPPQSSAATDHSTNAHEFDLLLHFRYPIPVSRSSQQFRTSFNEDGDGDTVFTADRQNINPYRTVAFMPPSLVAMHEEQTTTFKTTTNETFTNDAAASTPFFTQTRHAYHQSWPPFASVPAAAADTTSRRSSESEPNDSTASPRDLLKEQHLLLTTRVAAGVVEDYDVVFYSTIVAALVGTVIMLWDISKVAIYV